MRHIDTETVLRNATELLDQADAIRQPALAGTLRKHEAWSHIQSLITAIDRFHASIEFVKTLPEPAALAAAFRLKRSRKHRRTTKTLPRKRNPLP